MCGIAGQWRTSRFDVGAMLDAIAHRGPDGRGIVSTSDTEHGHVRLAIQDTSEASAQPFRYGGVLSYNGELWNAEELRYELTQLGYAFCTPGDTEVLAAALMEWGEDALDRLDGMFCFAWSPDVGPGFLARDRFGKLPLYIVRDADGMAWCSERKGFGRLAGQAYALPPATVWRFGDEAPRRYYSIPQLDDPDPEAVGDLLERGSMKRLIADVPVCTLLSGGVDSSLITAMIAKHRPDVVAYTVSFDDDSPDLIAAKEIAAYLGIEHRIVNVAPPTDADIADAIWTVEVANRVIVEIATLIRPLAARIREDGFRVVLSGEAADEIFGGYGNLARRAGSDAMWRDARIEFFLKMARANFHLVNKSFMAHGVEARLPFCERDLVESVLSMDRAQCPPGKRLLKHHAEKWLPKKVVHRPKLAFHDGTGTKTYLGSQYSNPVRYYNAVMKSMFGCIVRG